MPRREEIRIPDLGNFDEVPVVEVLVKPGDKVAAEAPLVSLESDKASMDVPSPAAGTIVEVRVQKGAKVKKDDVVAVIEVEEDAAPKEEKREEPSPRPSPASGRGRTEPAPQENEVKAVPSPARAGEGQGEGSSRRPPIDEVSFASAYASPAVRRLARELGANLGAVPGTGRGGRILKEDVYGYVKKALAGAAPSSGPGGFALPPMPAIDFSKFGEIERRPLSRIKKITATNVHRSWITVPHVTQHDEADITDMEAFRKEHAESIQKRGFKLTPLAFILKACSLTLREHPAVASSLAPGGEELIVKKYCHIGVAVDTPEGLVVPVVRDVDQKGVADLAKELAEISQRARDRRLKPDDIQGGVFTVSSLGGIGGTYFTPIVNAPEVAILGVSRARMTPVWKEGAFAGRLLLPLSLSYDHRVIDGAEAARFITHLSSVLADIRVLAL